MTAPARDERARFTVFCDILPSPRRSISSADFCGDKCCNSRNTGSSCLSRAAAGTRLFSATVTPGLAFNTGLPAVSYRRRSFNLTYGVQGWQFNWNASRG